MSRTFCPKCGSLHLTDDKLDAARPCPTCQQQSDQPISTSTTDPSKPKSKPKRKRRGH